MKETKTQTILSTERLGDEKRIQVILADWGMNEMAIEPMLDQHRALQARQERKDAALKKYPVAGRPAPVIFPGANSMR